MLGRNGAGKTHADPHAGRRTAGACGRAAAAPRTLRSAISLSISSTTCARTTRRSTPGRLAPPEREQVLRGWLGRFGFSGDDALRPVGPMSGGEKARLGLAMLAWRKPGFLVLDEPTNHLDAGARDALADALAEFDGALLLVSHDRYLLRATVDELLVIDDGRLAPFDGDLDDYAGWIADRAAAAANRRRPVLRRPGRAGRRARRRWRRRRRRRAPIAATGRGSAKRWPCAYAAGRRAQPPDRDACSPVIRSGRADARSATERPGARCRSGAGGEQSRASGPGSPARSPSSRTNGSSARPNSRPAAVATALASVASWRP